MARVVKEIVASTGRIPLQTPEVRRGEGKWPLRALGPTRHTTFARSHCLP
jgi:hypothetical protein